MSDKEIESLRDRITRLGKEVDSRQPDKKARKRANYLKRVEKLRAEIYDALKKWDSEYEALARGCGNITSNIETASDEYEEKHFFGHSEESKEFFLKYIGAFTAFVRICQEHREDIAALLAKVEKAKTIKTLNKYKELFDEYEFRAFGLVEDMRKAKHEAEDGQEYLKTPLDKFLDMFK